MKICDFTMPEIRVFLSECNFTEDETALFLLRAKNVPLEICAEEMNVSVKTIDRLHRKIKEKIGRVTNEVHKGGFTNRTETN